jgi:hypothetical protein
MFHAIITAILGSHVHVWVDCSLQFVGSRDSVRGGLLDVAGNGVGKCQLYLLSMLGLQCLFGNTLGTILYR